MDSNSSEFVVVDDEIPEVSFTVACESDGVRTLRAVIHSANGEKSNCKKEG